MEPGGARREKLPPPPIPLPQQGTPPKGKDGPSSRLEKAKQRAAQQELKQRQRAEVGGATLIGAGRSSRACAALARHV